MPRTAKKSPKKSASPAKKTKSPIKKERKKRAPKDPNAPKRAMSGYMLWLQDARPSLTKPGMSVADVAKLAGVEWGKMKDKTKWDKAAAEDKKRYEREMAAYKSGKSPKKSKK